MAQRRDNDGPRARRLMGVLAATVVAGQLSIGVMTPAHATAQTRYVATSGTDTDNDCSSAQTPCLTIQYAVDQADAGDTVSVAAGTYAESIVVRQTMSIVGAGTTIISGDQDDDPSVFIDGADVNVAPVVSLRGLTMSDPSDIGVLVASGATAALRNDSVTGNAGDGIDVESESTLIVSGSHISDNTDSGVELNDSTATISGSLMAKNRDGGLAVSGGRASLTTSVVEGNDGAGVVSQSGSTVVVSRSTVERTVPLPDSVEPFGGGLLAIEGSITASEDTIYGNTNFGVALVTATPDIAAHGRRPFGGLVAPAATAPAAEIDNSTITGTTTGKGSSYVGGLVGIGQRLTVAGTIDAANQTPDCNTAVTNAGYDLDSDGSCRLKGAGSKSHAAAHLGGLRNNGGPTPTVLPGVRSAARNAIPFGKAGCVKGATDQRGQARRSPAHGKCDIGAVEAKVVNPKLHAAVSGPKHHGHYAGRVTVKYHCTTGTAPLTHHCPKPTHLTARGTHHVKKTIHAVDGGKATIERTITIK